MEDRYQRYQNTAFTSQQWYIIKKAIDEDIEVKDIADPRFSVDTAGTSLFYRLGLDENFNERVCLNHFFNKNTFQVKEGVF